MMEEGPSESSHQTLLQVMSDIAPECTSSNVEARRKGLSTLLHYLSNSDLSSLSRAEVDHLAEFLIGKTRDHHSFYPLVIQSLRYTLPHPALSPSSQAASLRIFFNDVQVQSQMSADRHSFFQTLYILLSGPPSRAGGILDVMGREFVLGYLIAVEGETDPRSLFYIFNSWPILIRAFDIEPMVEDIFDVISCYFPLVLRSGDTPDFMESTLRSSLRSVMALTPLFAPFNLPLLTSKLDSELSSTREDVYETFSACVRIYEAPDLKPHLAGIWSPIKRDLFLSAKEGVLEELALDLLSTLSSRLLPSSEDHKLFVKDVVWFDLQEVINSSSSSKKKVIIRTIKALLTESSAQYVLCLTLPSLMKNMKDSSLPLLCELFEPQIINVEGLPGIPELKKELLSSLSSSVTLDALLSGGLQLFITDKEELISGLSSQIGSSHDGDEKGLAQVLGRLSLGSSLHSVVLPQVHRLSLEDRLSFLEVLCASSSSASSLESLYPILSAEILPHIGSSHLASQVLTRLSLSEPRIRCYLLKETDVYSRILQSQDSLELIAALSKDLSHAERSSFWSKDLSPLVSEAMWASLKPMGLKELSALPIYSHVQSSLQETPYRRLGFSFLNKIPLGETEEEVRGKDSTHSNWALRALVLKGYRLLGSWMEELLAKDVTDLEESFRCILRPPSEDLPLYENLRISPLYRQRVFVLSFEPLLEKYESTGHGPYLRCILLQSKELSLEVQRPYSSQISSLLLKALKSKEEAEGSSSSLVDVLSCLRRLLSAIKDGSTEPPVTEGGPLIPPSKEIFPLLNELTVPEQALRVRQLAVECMAELLPLALESMDASLSRDVMSSLNRALEDPKRLVRKAAVAAKNSWALIQGA